MGLHEKSLGSKGISPLIASVLSIMLGIMMLAVVLTVIQPTFKSAQDSSIIADIFQNLNLIDSAIREVSSEAQGSKRTITLGVSGGEYRINSTYDWVYATYEPKSDLRLTGRRGDIRVDRGLVYAEYFNWFPDGSTGEPEWTNTSGQWSVSDLRYVGSNGTSYINITPRPIESFEFSGSITNISGPSGGQIFLLPAPPTGLRGFWALDNRSGNKAYDFSGNNNTGTLTNMNTSGNSSSGWQDSSDCKAGGSCLMFDSVNDYVDCGNDASVNITGSFTIEAWINAAALTSWMRVIDKGMSSNGAPAIFLSNDNALKFQATIGGSNTGEVTIGSMSGSLNQWHHVAATYDGSVVKTYFDGAYSGNSVSRSGAVSTSNLNWCIGCRADTTTNIFDGKIDEVKIWNVALDDVGVAAEYELSAKKLQNTGSQSIVAKTYGSMVLSNPAGQTQFDNIKISRGALERLSFLVPYTRADINGTLRIQKGEYLVQIAHRGINSTSNKPIIEITAV